MNTQEPTPNAAGGASALTDGLGGTPQHELQQLIDNLRARDANMLNDINSMFGGGMTLENRLVLADSRAVDALAALCALARYVMTLEQKIERLQAAPALSLTHQETAGLRIYGGVKS